MSVCFKGYAMSALLLLFFWENLNTMFTLILKYFSGLYVFDEEDIGIGSQILVGGSERMKEVQQYNSCEWRNTTRRTYQQGGKYQSNWKVWSIQLKSCIVYVNVELLYQYFFKYIPKWTLYLMPFKEIYV